MCLHGSAPEEAFAVAIAFYSGLQCQHSYYNDWDMKNDTVLAHRSKSSYPELHDWASAV